MSDRAKGILALLVLLGVLVLAGWIRCSDWNECRKFHPRGYCYRQVFNNDK